MNDQDILKIASELCPDVLTKKVDVEKAPEELLTKQFDITVGDGKYTFIKYIHEYQIRVLRYGEPWLIIKEGHNAITALLQDYVDNFVKQYRKGYDDGWDSHKEANID